MCKEIKKNNLVDKAMEIKWIHDDNIAKQIRDQSKPNIYPYVEKVKNLSETAFNLLLAKERHWYILQVHTLNPSHLRPITMYIVGYAPKFTEIINASKED